MPNTPVPAAAPGLPTPTRRALLGRGLPAALTLATMPAAAEPVAVSPPDPIFAALAAHKAAWDELGITSALTDEIAALEEGRHITAADRARDHAAGQAEQDALDTLASTPPTSAAGLIAALAWLWHTGDLVRIDQFVTTLVESSLAGGSDV